ncbi:hypothetical protein FRB99_006717 [Tulasnella sp. 403]|nr:hypothetical protein FRB99_006717 [Tulasnella sp. 403]
MDEPPIHQTNNHATVIAIPPLPADDSSQQLTLLSNAVLGLLPSWPVAGLWRFVCMLAGRPAMVGSPVEPPSPGPQAEAIPVHPPPAYEEYPTPPPPYNEAGRDAEAAG